MVVVANRLPVDEAVSDSGGRTWRRSPGGLVSALEPVLGYGTTWVGWAGGADTPRLADLDGVTMRAVALSS